MAIVNPLVKEKAAPEVRETLEGLTNNSARYPTFSPPWPIDRMC